MSTTVSYKGNTIATVENNTKTLKTAGKYLEGDVVLTDVSGGGSAGTTYHATITTSNANSRVRVEYNGTRYYKDGDSFDFYAGDTVTLKIGGSIGGGSLYINGVIVKGSQDDITIDGYILQNCDINFSITNGSMGSMYITSSTDPSLLVSESGIWIPDADTTRGTIQFSGTHIVPPALVQLFDISDYTTYTAYSLTSFRFTDVYRFNGQGIPIGASESAYSVAEWTYGETESSFFIENDSSQSSQNTYITQSRYWVDIDAFHPYTNQSNCYWRAGRQYKWIATWAPLTC